MKLGLIQMRAREDKEESLALAEKYIASAAKMGADIVMLPEMFNCPYSTENFRAYAEPEGGPSWTRMAEAARRHKVYLIAGSMPEYLEAGNRIVSDRSAHVFNTSYVFDRNGKQLAKHRKMHLFDINVRGGQYFCESDVLTAGDEVTTFDTEFGRFGVMICYDIRFPELSRLMADQGAVMVFVPACFNMTTGPAHWELLFRARALDNQMFMAGCAQARTKQKQLFAWQKPAYVSYGHSIITSPWGEVLTQMDEQEGTMIQEIDLNRVLEVRNDLPVLSQRRKDVYTLEKKATETLKDDLETGIHYIGYRYSTTGAFGYIFCEDSVEKCRVGCGVIPSPPVYIHGKDRNWVSKFDNETTIVPGLTRTVKDEKTSAEAARITLKDVGRFIINNSIDVFCDQEGKYTFYANNALIGRITRFEGSCSRLPEAGGCDVEPYFDVTITDGLDEEQVMLITAFPMLRFSL